MCFYYNNYLILIFSLYVSIENNNDDAKHSYFSSNRHDAAHEILVTEARLEELRRDTANRESCVREKRKCVKFDTRYRTENHQNLL